MKLEQICEVPTDEHSPDGKTLYKPCGKGYNDICYCNELNTCKYWKQWEILREEKKKTYVERVAAFWRGEQKEK